MTGFTDWTPPRFSPTSIPTLPAVTLSESEQALISGLMSRMAGDRANMELTNAYYMGAQAIDNLKISIPDALARRLRTLVGWARVAVDPMVERLAVEGFRLPGETDVNDTLADLWVGNGLDAEFTMAATDALSMSRAYWLVGSGADGRPRITVESPLSTSVQWDVTGRNAKAALQSYIEDDQRRAALYLPSRTIHIAQNENREWVLVDVDPHNFGHVPLKRMANNPRTDNLNGYSEITPELMSVIDSACRRLMGLEAASELYSVPRMLILGASAEDFQDSNGTVRKAWDAYINKINFLEKADEEGNNPTVTQLTAYDPSVFTKVLEMYASQAAGILAAVPQDLGLYTDGNPVSAEAWNATETRRNRRAISKQKTFGVPLVEVMQMALRFQNNGALSSEFERIEVDWMRPETVTFAQNADAVAKLAAPTVGAIPATSDVTLKRLGFNAVERAQLEKDRGAQNAMDIRTALKEAADARKAKETVTNGDAGTGTVA